MPMSSPFSNYLRQREELGRFDVIKTNRVLPDEAILGRSNAYYSPKWLSALMSLGKEAFNRSNAHVTGTRGRLVSVRFDL